ncbi:MAG: universal stress protein [Calditrichaeota bacterium]|nr:MAG: universal stress protein [Calditrichota bacterium]
MKVNHILVPIDFSEYSEQATQYAIFLAEHYGAEITLLHAVVLFHEDISEKAQVEQYQKLAEMKEKEIHEKMVQQHEVVSERGVQVKTEIRRGINAAEVILEYASEAQPDLIVIGTHGRSGLKKWIYGSVAEKVVRSSPIPVLTVHHSLESFSIKKILVPVDFSEQSQQAIKTANDIARDFSATPYFLHVIEHEIHPAYYTAEVVSLFEIDPELKERAKKRLQEFVGVSDESRIMVTEGKAFREILNYIEEEQIDLTVMGARSGSGLEHFLVGSTADRVVRLAPCPVLTVGREEQ